MATQNDEQKPLTELSQSVSDDEEEKKNPHPSNIAQSYQNSSFHESQISELDRDPKINHAASQIIKEYKESGLDVSTSSFLICRITIFMYAFVSCLIISYFPEVDPLNIPSYGLFIFFMYIDVFSCIIGMAGVYLNHPKLIFVCWIILMVILILTAILVIIYVFSSSGLSLEASNRCINFGLTTSFEIPNCERSMRHQLRWTIVGLFVIYAIVSSFGIHIIRHTEQIIAETLKQDEIQIKLQNELNDDTFSDNDSIHTDDDISDMDDDNDSPQPDQPKRSKTSSTNYDIQLEDIEQKKNQ